jgi:hypothetical protein
VTFFTSEEEQVFLSRLEGITKMHIRTFVSSMQNDDEWFLRLGFQEEIQNFRDMTQCSEDEIDCILEAYKKSFSKAELVCLKTEFSKDLDSEINHFLKTKGSLRDCIDFDNKFYEIICSYIEASKRTFIINEKEGYFTFSASNFEMFRSGIKNLLKGKEDFKKEGALKVKAICLKVEAAMNEPLCARFEKDSLLLQQKRFESISSFCKLARHNSESDASYQLRVEKAFFKKPLSEQKLVDEAFLKDNKKDFNPLFLFYFKIKCAIDRYAESNFDEASLEVLTEAIESATKACVKKYEKCVDPSVLDYLKAAALALSGVLLGILTCPGLIVSRYRNWLKDTFFSGVTSKASVSELGEVLQKGYGKIFF